MKHITQEQRYTISAMLAQGVSYSMIANTINVHKSSVGREIKRNCDERNLQYKSDLATRKCLKRHKEKPKHTIYTPEMSLQIEHLLRLKYSPEQIHGWSSREGIAMISHESIYRRIWADKKEGGILHTHLRSKGKKYRKRGALKDKRGQISNKRHISERPAIVEEKSRIGDLEIDTVIGKNHQGALVTINDRKTNLIKIVKVDGKHAKEVTEATIKALSDWNWIKTITSDNGKEFAFHEQIAKALNVEYFFATPYHSWERGANENTNGLIRQYIPKKTDFSTITDEYVQMVEDELNNRPRKKHGYLTPKEVILKEINKSD